MVKRNNRRKSKIKIKIFFFILFLAAGLSIAVIFAFRADTVEFTGSQRYSSEELSQLIFHGSHPNTVLYYFFGKKNIAIPFIQKYDVDIKWPHTVDITVYEKPVIGFVDYMGSNMYFDKDGIVVESSSNVLAGVPQVTGLEFRSIVLNSRLEVSNQNVFTNMLDLKQSFDKYSLKVDRVNFEQNSEVTLYMQNVKILLGNSDKNQLVDKLYELKQIAPGLEGRKGILHLENYSEDSSSVIFKQEK